MGSAKDWGRQIDVQELSLFDVIVIGNGPVGVHFVNQLLQNEFPGRIAIFGDEEYRPYNRVKLSSYLNGDIPFSALENPITVDAKVTPFWHCRVNRIDTQAKRITDQFGNTYRYHSLVLATGSTPHIPSTPGQNLTGVYCFRNMKDTEALFARRLKSRSTVVVGGGLLGLETAKAMLRHSTNVTLVHHSNRLMNRQLDEAAAERLQKYAEEAGINVLVNRSLHQINGEVKVESVVLNTHQILDCDTIVFATGIRPNTQLAVEAKLRVHKGIVIDEYLQTSQTDVYAIGECADFNGQIFGLVAPGLEQASVLASNLCGEKCSYTAASLITKLKVLGMPVFSMGSVGDEYENQITSNLVFESDDKYRRLLFTRGKLAGAIFVGEATGIKQLQTAVQNKQRALPWHKKRFSRTGNLFSEQQNSVSALPDKTIVCNCQQISVGEIRQFQRKATQTFELLQETLKVSTVCGTCKPLIQSLLDEPVERQPVKHKLLTYSLVAALLAITWLLLPTPRITDSVQITDWTWLWTDSLARQVSGFTILGLTATGLVFSLRKRLPTLKWLSFEFWRGWHVALSSIGLAALFAHTGVSIGNGINRWLIVNFLLIIGVGIASGVVAAFEGYWVSPRIKAIKRVLVWGHILTFWPFPILLAYHILSVYYF